MLLVVRPRTKRCRDSRRSQEIQPLRGSRDPPPFCRSLPPSRPVFTSRAHDGGPMSRLEQRIVGCSPSYEARPAFAPPQRASRYLARGWSSGGGISNHPPRRSGTKRAGLGLVDRAGVARSALDRPAFVSRPARQSSGRCPDHAPIVPRFWSPAVTGRARARASITPNNPDGATALQIAERVRVLVCNRDDRPGLHAHAANRYARKSRRCSAGHPYRGDLVP